jgi:putative oxygen-independent coproporphyrinogen III oxidase
MSMPQPESRSVAGTSASNALSSLSLPSLLLPPLTELPPLSLYVHIPWCLRKCPYCDFNSHAVPEGHALPAGRVVPIADATPQDAALPESRYAEALLRDLEWALPQVWGRRVQSVFFGGGTPSLFSARTIADLIAGFRARLNLMPDCEITLEANPGSFELGKFRDFEAAGVNRLSLGIQSFDSSMLRALGRVHDGDEALRAANAAVEIFPRVNLDLMLALPQQTLAQALADARQALQIGASHLSFYHLTLEPNTEFHRRPPALPDEDSAAAMQDAVAALLQQAGFEHYETSAWAQPGQQCRHNLNYWRFGDYLGIGAGAHAKISLPDRILRQTRPRLPRDYMQQALAGTPMQEQRELGRDERVFEFMMNALRLHEGFAVAEFVARTGLQISVAQPALEKAEARGLIERDHVRIKATPLGRRFLNDLLEIFL